MRRHRRIPGRVLRCAVVAVALMSPAIARGDAGTNYKPADYWAFADARQRDMDPVWDPQVGVYRHVANADVRINGNMLITHAIAALTGHAGAARHDDRARAIADALLHAPAFHDGPSAIVSPRRWLHTPGWSGSTQHSGGGMHGAIGAKTAEALSYAYLARKQLRLGRRTIALIRDRIRRVAAGKMFAYPAVQLNQWNWNADLYVAASLVTSSVRRLRGYRAQLVRFARTMRRPMTGMSSPNLNRGLGLHYAITSTPAKERNRSDSAEYANLILSGLSYYDWAVEHGMRALGAADERRLRAWAARVMYGDWTHAGYMNWDTGLGYNRWHMARYLAFAGSGLLTLATGERLGGARRRARAKWLFDRFLDTYERRAGQNGHGMLAAMPFGLRGPEATWDGDGRTSSARYQALAARAAVALAGMTARRPASFFAHDPDIGRLAVSTAAYNTGVQAFAPAGYGGLELARLYDRHQEPMTGIGGRGRAALGLDLRRGGRVVLDSQPGDLTGRTGPWRVSGGATRGTFTRRLRATNTLRWGSDRVRIAHTFRPHSVTTTRTLRSRRGGLVTLRLPVWGLAASARVARAGRVVTVHATAARSAFTARISGLPRGATVELAAVSAQRSNPRGVRTVLVRFKARPLRAYTTRVTIVPAR